MRRDGPDGPAIAGQVCPTASLDALPAVAGAGLVKPHLQLYEDARATVGLRSLCCALPRAGPGPLAGQPQALHGRAAGAGHQPQRKWQPVLVESSTRPAPNGPQLVIEALVRVSRDVGDRATLLCSMAAQVGVASLACAGPGSG